MSSHFAEGAARRAGQSCSGSRESRDDRHDDEKRQAPMAEHDPVRLERTMTGAEVRAMSDTEAIVQDRLTGLFGFRLEMGRDHGGIRMQARRSGFVTETAAKTEYGRLCRQRDAQHPKPRLGDSVQNVCEGWVRAR
jgi:hypothetical protein